MCGACGGGGGARRSRGKIWVVGLTGKVAFQCRFEVKEPEGFEARRGGRYGQSRVSRRRVRRLTGKEGGVLQNPGLSLSWEKLQGGF